MVGFNDREERGSDRKGKDRDQDREKNNKRKNYDKDRREEENVAYKYGKKQLRLLINTDRVDVLCQIYSGLFYF